MPSYTSGPLKFFNTFRQWVADGTFDLDADAFYGTLHSSSLTPSASSSLYTLGAYNELSTANGYTQGQVAANLFTTTFSVVTATPAIAAFTNSTKVVTATGALNPKYLLIHSTANRNGHALPLVGWVDLAPSTTTATIAVANGEVLTIQWPLAQLFQIQGG